MDTNKHTLKLERIIEALAWPILLIIIFIINSRFHLTVSSKTAIPFAGLVLTISLFYYYLAHTLIPLTKKTYLKTLSDVIFLAILLFLAIQTKSYISLIAIVPICGTMLIYSLINPLLISLITIFLIAAEIMFETLYKYTISLDPVEIFIIIAVLITFFLRLLAQNAKYQKTIKEELQLKLATASDRLNHLEAHGKEFPNLAAQQIFTPLATIQSFVQTLHSEQDGKLNQKQKAFITETSKYIEKMHKLIKELLYISKLEFTKSVTLKPTDALEAIKTTIERYKQQADESKITINLNLPSENLPSIFAEKNTLPDIYARLIDNAIRYSPPESQVDITLQVFHKNDGPHLYTEIKDHGYGIPQEEQKYLFRKFFRGTNIIDKYSEGKGLSLYIIKLMLDQQNAKIHSKSKIDEGSIFQIDFPVAPTK